MNVEKRKAPGLIPVSKSDFDGSWLDDEESWLITSLERNEDEANFFWSDGGWSNTSIPGETKTGKYLKWWGSNTIMVSKE